MSGIALLAIFAAVPLALAIWVVATYNRLVRRARQRDEAWSGVLVQLKRRHDLVPNLVAVVEGYARHEKKVREKVAKMRSFGGQGEPRAVGETERAFSQCLVRLLAVVENYPEIKADRNFRELQNALIRVEDDIQMSRRYYNGTVRDYNLTVESFPSLLVAKGFSFRESQFFELESPAEADMPTVSFNVRDT